MNKIDSVLLLLPRQHTNIKGWLYYFRKSNIQCSIFVTRTSPFETDLVSEKKLLVSIWCLIWRIIFNRIKTQHSYSIIRADRFVHTILLAVAVSLSGGRGCLYCQVPEKWFKNRNLDRRLIALRFKILSRLTKLRVGTCLPENIDFRAEHRCGRSLFFPLLPCVTGMHNQIHPPQAFCSQDWTRLNFVTIGKFVQRKNFLKILIGINSKFCASQFHITFIGECTTSQHRQYLSLLKQEINSLNLNSNVSIKTNIPPSKVFDDVERDSIFIFDSHSEPAIWSPVEANFLGYKVIVPRTYTTNPYLDTGVMFTEDFLKISAAKFQRFSCCELHNSHCLAGKLNSIENHFEEFLL